MLPTYLHSFAEDAKKESEKPGTAPNAISGSALDGNFAACLPIKTTGNNPPYTVKADKDGWRLEPTMLFDICENGVPVQYRFFAQRAQ
jgi:hypothetical protein